MQSYQNRMDVMLGFHGVPFTLALATAPWSAIVSTTGNRPLDSLASDHGPCFETRVIGIPHVKILIGVESILATCSYWRWQI